MTTNGDGVVKVNGPANETSISVACDVILSKLSSMHYATLAY